MTIYDADDKEIIIPSNLGNGGINYTNGYEDGYNEALSKATSLTPIAGGTYIGLYNEVYVPYTGTENCLWIECFGDINIKPMSVIDMSGMVYSEMDMVWKTYDKNTILESSDYALYYFSRTSSADKAGFRFWITGTGYVNVGGTVQALLGYNGVMGERAFYQLFLNSRVKDASQLELPYYTLTPHCYDDMFCNCSLFENAPVLPATELAEGCYYGMFSKCYALTTAPELPATTLAKECYYQMFDGCTSLTTAPILSATELAEGCYGYMFYHSNLLNKITIKATSYDSSAFEGWLGGVASEGDFYNYGGAEYPIGISGIPKGWTEHTKPTVANYMAFENTGEYSEYIVLMYSGSENHKFYYSYDALTWNDFSFNWDTTVMLEPNQTVYIKGDNPYGTSDSEGDYDSTDVQVQFYVNNYDNVGNGSVKVTGNLNALLGEDMLDAQDLTNVNFSHLFYEAKDVTDVSELQLPGTILGGHTYQSLFTGTSITTTPTVYVESMSEWGIARMFDTCEKLTTVDNITINCDVSDYQMFCFLARSPLIDFIHINFASLEGISFTWCESAKETGAAIFPTAVMGQETYLPSTWTIIYSD